MTIKFVTSRTNPHVRRRQALDLSRPVLTSQEQAGAADINQIVAQFQRTGVFPQPIKIPHYTDNTSTPTLEDAFRTVSEAREAFSALPSDIRKLMDNDPSKMDQFVSNPNNYDMLVKHGLLIPREEPKSPPESSQAEPIEKTEKDKK